jgi:hypothetical protein
MLFQVEGQEIEATITGVVDFDDERSRIRMRFPALTRQEQRDAGFPHDEIRDGLTKYVSTPLLREQIDAHWAKVDFGEMVDGAGIDTEALAQWDESDPRDLLRFLEAAGGAKPAGREWIGGSRTTRYDASVSVERFAEVVAADADAEFRRGFVDGMRKQLGSDEIETRVWLDQDGLIRREEVDMDMVIYGERIEGTMRLDLNDFGDQHDVVLPDDGDAIDVTDEWDKYKVHFTG